MGITTDKVQNGIPDELTVPAAEWLARNGYQTLQAAFVQSMVAYGYGDYRQVPIVCSQDKNVQV